MFSPLRRAPLVRLELEASVDPLEERERPDLLALLDLLDSLDLLLVTLHTTHTHFQVSSVIRLQRG